MCLSLRAGVPKCRRQPVYVGAGLAWQTPGSGRFSLGSWRIARSSGASESGGNPPGAPGCRAPLEWDKPGGPSGLNSLFPELVGAGSAAWQRVGTAGCGPRRGQGLPAVGARPGGSRGLSLLLGSPISAWLLPACTPGGLVLKFGLRAPARASVWVQGAGVCVSVRVCHLCCGTSGRLLRDTVGHSEVV